MKNKGRIHSYEVGSTVDGPGLRFVVFTQGCPLRCLYCHNPDTRDPLKGREVTVEELIHEMSKYHSYFDHGHGGITVTGGEPLMQSEFVASLFREAKAQGLHTALDTSGFASLHHLDLVLPYTDLVLLDIKSSIPELYHRVTHVDLHPTLETARHLEHLQKKMWIRFVLVPGLTDGEDNIRGIAEIAASLSMVERVEVLPFHKLGAYKWKEMDLTFELENTPIPTEQQILWARSIFTDAADQKQRQIVVC
jgi:pyruvate formate lyase activating enzyme